MVPASTTSNSPSPIHSQPAHFANSQRSTASASTTPAIAQGRALQLANHLSRSTTMTTEATPPAPKANTGNLDAEIQDVAEQLPNEPSPPLKEHTDFIHCLPPKRPTYREYSVFLAGSIEMGRAIQWQRLMVKHLQNLPITVCNPRRGHWDPTVTPAAKDKAFREQVDWELDALTKCSVICFFFDKNTMSPVTLMELGLWAHSKKVVVCCDKDFWKSGNVHIVTGRYGIPCVEKFSDLVPEIKRMLYAKGMRHEDLGDDAAIGKLAVVEGAEAKTGKAAQRDNQVVAAQHPVTNNAASGKLAAVEGAEAKTGQAAQRDNQVVAAQHPVINNESPKPPKKEGKLRSISSKPK